MSETAVLLRHETLMLTVPEITADEAAMIESQIHAVIAQNKGEVVSFERWGKYRLAYPIRKNEYGVYFLVRFDFPKEKLGESIEEIRRLCAIKFHDIIMRHLTVKLDRNAPLTYKRPESLEEMPRHESEEGRSSFAGEASDENPEEVIEIEEVTEDME